MNRHSPLTFWGILIIPLAFCVAHAQDTANSNDPFNKMFNQARDQERQKILDKFDQNQQSSPPPFPSAVGGVRGAQGEQQKIPESVPAPSIPVPSVAPTNTGVPAAPPNIYVPPPPPSSSASKSSTAPLPSASPSPVQPGQLPQSSINIYG